MRLSIYKDDCMTDTPLHDCAVLPHGNDFQISFTQADTGGRASIIGTADELLNMLYDLCAKLAEAAGISSPFSEPKGMDVRPPAPKPSVAVTATALRLEILEMAMLASLGDPSAWISAAMLATDLQNLAAQQRGAAEIHGGSFLCLPKLENGEPIHKALYDAFVKLAARRHVSMMQEAAARRNASQAQDTAEDTADLAGIRARRAEQDKADDAAMRTGAAQAAIRTMEEVKPEENPEKAERFYFATSLYNSNKLMAVSHEPVPLEAAMIYFRVHIFGQGHVLNPLPFNFNSGIEKGFRLFSLPEPMPVVDLAEFIRQKSATALPGCMAHGAFEALRVE